MSMKGKILIIEDNELNLKLFNDLFEAHKCETVETRDGRKALELALKEKPDLILMDIQLPEISGLEVIRNLKSHKEVGHIPIIAVTAFAMKDDEEKILASGCEAYVAKPISIEPFMKVVEKYLH